MHKQRTHPEQKAPQHVYTTQQTQQQLVWEGCQRSPTFISSCRDSSWRNLLSVISFSGSHCCKRAAAILVRSTNISGAARSHSNSAVERASSKQPAGLPASPAVQLRDSAFALTPGNIKLLIKQIQKER